MLFVRGMICSSHATNIVLQWSSQMRHAAGKMQASAGKGVRVKRHLVLQRPPQIRAPCSWCRVWPAVLARDQSPLLALIATAAAMLTTPPALPAHLHTMGVMIYATFHPPCECSHRSCLVRPAWQASR